VEVYSAVTKPMRIGLSASPASIRQVAEELFEVRCGRSDDPRHQRIEDQVPDRARERGTFGRSSSHRVDP
jgi:hypothetical protein